ncbi:hypothetical protein ACMG4H_03245 [Corynebacterium glutamicum]|uniref:Uncharacterized protein n=1 Tax=Corynebacterium glutamicum (strain R) TaxID=340322 RepID=A0AB72V942_CORGB|nr:hypothetical protein [Corynebacterium glutamicum]AGN17906.1 hypothetical protein C624_01585 [Corynebacterium glutamicum SCgG1]AGN20929.1 hypothetical protein C629_01585 [Corynebacterium glutamicum SCgG2]EGV40835.1 hypothetical protein CgS9114_05732 [Corynebacterium glutamicum S9114]EOA64829.1 hypothetical protein J433_06675 [Corynebacterium glutamicum MT]EPP41894.1 hypothetical protein A583_01127 [Corynebacterium glutamicum Z188]
MLSIPLIFTVENIETTGSSVVDFLGSISIWLYDIFGDTGSATIEA